MGKVLIINDEKQISGLLSRIFHAENRVDIFVRDFGKRSVFTISFTV